MMWEPQAAWRLLQDHGQRVLQLAQAHPWMTVGGAAVTAIVWSYIRAPGNLPPGPRGLPLLGAPRCLVEDLGRRMLEWRTQYGDIVSYYLLGDLTVMLNSEKLIREAFVKRGDEFAHRHNVIELFGGVDFGDEIFAAPFNETWKNNKKFAMASLKNYGFGTAKSEGKVHDQIQILEEKLLKTNGSAVDLSEDLKLLDAGIIYVILLGEISQDDPALAEMVRLFRNWMTSMNNMFLAKGFLGMLFPRLMNFKVRHLAKLYQEGMDAIIEFLVEKINKNAVDYREREADCVADVYLKERGSDAEAVRGMAGTFLGFLPDAIETSSMFNRWAILYIIHHPDIQKKLREEINAVSGTSRLPMLNDRADMPFCQAVIHEVLRLVILVQASLPRVVLDDTTLEGFNLPKGTLVSANFYAVHFDPAIFPEPNNFNPSRFIMADGKFDTGLAGKVMTFSLGTRKCVGEAFFKVQIFLLVTRLLQRFTLEFDPDSPKPTLEKDAENIMGPPTQFKVCFKPI